MRGGLKYYVQEWKSPLPHCRKCFNFGQSCGTPCTCCKDNERWNKTWQLYLYLEGILMVYQRRLLEGSKNAKSGEPSSGKE